MFRIGRNQLLSLMALVMCGGVIDCRANPNKKPFVATPGELLTAAKKAAAGHTILALKDRSTEVFSDESQDVLSFAFLTRIPGFTPTVVATVSITERSGGRSELELFFHRKGTTTAWVPSTEFETRKARYESDLQLQLSTIENAQSALETLWNIGRVKHDEYYAKKRALDAQELSAKENALTLIQTAKMEDMAQMPRSTFEAMDEEAETYFSMVQKNLVVGGADSAAERRSQTLRNCAAFEQQLKNGTITLNERDVANYLKKCSDVRSGKLND